jgi:hypothetical protein
MSGVIDLNCEDYEVKAGSIGHGHDGCVFRCTVGPVPEKVSSDLAAAAALGSAIRLGFPGQPLLLERFEIERIDGARIRIVGRVSDAETKKGLLP